MSTAVSRAAKELAKQMYPMSEGQGEEMARRIQSALANLLEKAETLHCVYGGDAPSRGCACSNCEVAKALEPWKAGE